MACRWHGVVSSSVSSSESKASRKQAHDGGQCMKAREGRARTLYGSAQAHVAMTPPDRERTVWDVVWSPGGLTSTSAMVEICQTTRRPPGDHQETFYGRRSALRAELTCA